ncbi:MAG: molybdopterin molybdotransferase MoeA [Burkholderiaceae bacterium]
MAAPDSSPLPTDAGERLARAIARLEGYDPAALPVAQARQIIEAVMQPVRDFETVELRDALGRILVADLLSTIDVPAHDNSAMDGVATATSSLAAGESRLKIVGAAYAGKPFRGEAAPGQAVRVMTGAIMPRGTDLVVPQELTRADGSDHVWIPAGQRAGQHLRRRGEDLTRGLPALTAGTRIGPAHMGLIASLGVARVEVRRRIRVAFFSSGDEIRSIGEPLGEGQIYDSNRYTLTGLLLDLGCELHDLGVVPDDPASIETAVREAAVRADLIISSGGVSVGAADHTKAVMQRIGGVRFWTIAMRPGRPMAFGDVGGCAYFGLPGNPVAVMITFLFFVKPAIQRLMGRATDATAHVRATALSPFKKRAGRTEFQRGILGRAHDGSMQVTITGQQGSGVLSSMTNANCIVLLHHEQGSVAVGDSVDCLPFEGLLR